MMAQDLEPTTEKLGAMIITTVLERWPQTAEVFHTHGMACVGCAVAPFFTINDAALVYGLEPAAFVGELLATIRATVGSTET
jgi:hybrid cluster-associated redox disulfide protein